MRFCPAPTVTRNHAAGMGGLGNEDVPVNTVDNTTGKGVPRVALGEEKGGKETTRGKANAIRLIAFKGEYIGTKTGIPQVQICANATGRRAIAGRRSCPAPTVGGGRCPGLGFSQGRRTSGSRRDRLGFYSDFEERGVD